MNKSLRLLAYFAIVLAASGCATGNPVQSASVKIASADSLKACQYLDTVYGTSSWYGMFAEAGMENARLSAFDKAQKLGASHLSWEPALAQSFGSTNVAAKVYRC